MNNKKSLETLLRHVFPVISILTYVTAFAIMFDTFNLALDVAFYNILLSLPVFGLVLMVCRRYHISVIFSCVAAFVLFYLDQYVFASRLTHIRFSDIELIAQAVRVANRYPLIWNLEIMRRLLIVASLCFFLIILYCYYKLEFSKKSVFFTGLGIFVVSGVLIVLGVIPGGKEDYDFSSDAEDRGLLYSWYCQEKGSKLEAPENYSKEEAERILAQYEAIAGDEDVNVLVIMNESMTDYSLIGEPNFHKDPLPFIHSLVQDGDAFEGKLVTSVFGGGTATTEYEFLTGNTVAFLPQDASPYLQYVDGRTDNLTSEMKEKGYDTKAIHPYYSQEWNRSQVYKFFGFDQFISGEDFGNTVVSNGKSATSHVPDNLISFGEGPLYVRGLISDQTDYERVLEETTDLSFIFNVTMQNHGGYDYNGADFTSDEYVSEKDRKEGTLPRSLHGMLYSQESGSVEEEIGKVNQYLTLSNLSDQAFEYLIGELGKSNKKTVVLIFGDHQPGILISEKYVDCEEGIDPDYTVPYVLWSNFDMEFEAPDMISPNYLSAVLKKNAGLGLTEWDQFRLDMMKEYPVVTANTILDKNGNAVGKNGLKDYEMVQYMRMFENR